MNFRNIALVAALVSVAGVASAASFELKAGAGATLVGNTFQVSGSSFSVEIWTVGEASNVTSMGCALAFDTTTATSLNGLGPTGMAGKLSTTTAGFSGGTLPAPLNWLATPVIRAGAAPTANANITPPAGQRALVTFYGASTGGPTTVSIGAQRVATVTFSHALGVGEVYGDAAGEIGLQMYVSNAGAAASGGTSSFGPVGVGGQAGSAKYAVANAVPEPTTMAALGLGLAAIARRRRNKK